jgi:Zn-dependent M28 family amino/carboxypeptidase
MHNRTKWLILVIGLSLVAFLFSASIWIRNASTLQVFDGSRAYQDVNHQLSFGARIPDSQAHSKTIDYIESEMKKSGWDVSGQDTQKMGHPIHNVIAKRGSGSPWVILGAHYDSRLVADQDTNPAARLQPVMGANDGASGVAVLLELGRVLPKTVKGQVWLVFFDAEDQGNIAGWDWILGSRAFVESLQGKPDSAIVIDMIGDKDLDLYWERNSNILLTQNIWSIAAQNGYAKQFIGQYKYSMIDDHTPFLERGIRAVDIIDFDYPFWHTSGDTVDKVSPESLKAIGDTLYAWLLSQ